jgi:hypothetical protein
MKHLSQAFSLPCCLCCASVFQSPLYEDLGVANVKRYIWMSDLSLNTKWYKTATVFPVQQKENWI